MKTLTPALAPLLLCIGSPNNHIVPYLMAGAFGFLGVMAALPIRGVR